MNEKMIMTAGLILLSASTFAAQRVVVLEVATGTWCTYCQGAALGAEELASEYPGEVLVIEYHCEEYTHPDLFANDEGMARVEDFYSIPGPPCAIFDGVDSSHAGSSAASLFSTYQPMFLARKEVASPLEIVLEKTYDKVSHEGTLTATIVNTSDDSISGKARFTVTESHIAYHWEDRDSLHYVERDMLTDAEGELISLGPGDTLMLEREFLIDPQWYENTENPLNFELGSFVQDEGTGLGCEVYQGAVIPLIAPLEAEVVSSKIDNQDGLLHPWEEVDFYVTLENTGKDPWEELSGILTTEDTYVEIVDSAGSWGAAEPKETVCNLKDPFRLKTNSDCPEGHRPVMNLALTDGLGQNTEVEFKVFEPLGMAEADPGDFHLQVPSILTGTAFMSISLPAPSDVEVALIDASGRIVKELFSDKASAGTNLVSISAQDIPEGAYFIKATAGNLTAVEKVLIVD